MRMRKDAELPFTYMGEVNKQIAVMFPVHKPAMTVSVQILKSKILTKQNIQLMSLMNCRLVSSSLVHDSHKK